MASSYGGVEANQQNQLQDQGKALQALKALYEDFWDKPESPLVSEETVEYKIADGSSASKTCQVFHLDHHKLGIRTLGFPLWHHLVVPQEYRDALQSLKDEDTVPGHIITGQPGIGKSLFLLYVLLMRMQETMPVAIHVSYFGYYVVDEEGVVFCRSSESYDLQPLNKHEGIWCLSDSNRTTRVPAEEFVRCPTARIIQAASPNFNRWKDWKKETGAHVYVMDTWDDGELVLLANIQGGESFVSKVAPFVSRWGPSPRYLMMALKQDASSKLSSWERDMRLTINTAAEQLAQDPVGVHSGVLTLTYESIASPVLWLRPNDKATNRQHYDAYIPNASEIVNSVRNAFDARSADELVHHFNLISRNPSSRSTAGHMFESAMHGMITGGHRAMAKPFTLHGLDGSSKNIMPVTLSQFVSSQADLHRARLPFYYRPSQANYPGIDSALCTESNVYTIQATISTKHTLALDGLQKLYSELLPEHRLQIQDWYLLFASPDQEVGQHLAEVQSEVIKKDTKWRDIKIGFFTPPGVNEFAPLMETDEGHSMMEGHSREEDHSTSPLTSLRPSDIRSKGHMMMDDPSEETIQPTLPSTSATKTKSKQKGKREREKEKKRKRKEKDEMTMQSTSSSDVATSAAKKLHKNL